MLKKSQLFEVKTIQPTNPEQYFQQLQNNIVQARSKKLAENVIEKSASDIFQLIQKNLLPVSNNKINIEDEYINDPETARPIEQLLKDRKYLELDKLRRELSVNIMHLENQLNINSAEDESRKIRDLKNTLCKKILAIEQDMTLMKCETKLENRDGQFLTRKANYIKHDESQKLKLNVSHIANPQNFLEQEEFIKKIIHERKELKKKRVAKSTAYEELIKIEEQNIENEKKKELQETNAEKRKKIIEYIADLEQKQKVRQQNLQTQNQQVIDILRKEKKQKRALRKLDYNLNNPNLSQKNETLKAIKEIHAPLRKDVLDQREEKYREMLEEKQALRTKKQEERSKITYQASFTSGNYLKAKNETLQLKRLQQEEMKRIVEKTKNKKLFGEQIREEFFPEIDVGKQAEMEDLKGKQYHSVDFKGYVELARNFKKHGVFFDKETGGVQEVQMVNEHYDKLYQPMELEESLREKGKRYLSDAGRLNRNNHRENKSISHVNTANTRPSFHTQEETKSKVVIKKIDYLQEQKNKHASARRLQKGDIESITHNQNIPIHERERMIMEQKEWAQRETIKKEQILNARMNRDSNIVKESEELDDLIYKQIKAKLVILKRDKPL